VVQSVADAGHTHVTLRFAESSLQLTISLLIFRPGLFVGEPDLFFRRDGQIELLRKRTFAPLDITRPAELAATVSEACGGSECLKHARVLCEAGAPFAGVFEALVPLASAQTKLTVSFAREVATQRPWAPPVAASKDPPLPLKRKARRAVRISSLTTSDNLSVDVTRPPLEAQLNDLVSCYEETSHAPAARLMQVELEVGKVGVIDATIRGDDLIDYDLDCLYRALARASIPAPSRGTHGGGKQGAGKTGVVTAGFAFTRAP